MAKLTDNAVATALVASHGNISAAARALGVVRSAIQKRVHNSPDLQQALIDARETMLDNGESSLARAVLQGEAWAVCFLLKTQGRARGYIERQEMRLVSDEDINTAIERELARLAGDSETAAAGEAPSNRSNGKGTNGVHR